MKKRDRPSGDALFFYGDAVSHELRLRAAAEVGDQETDVPLTLRLPLRGSTPICI